MCSAESVSCFPVLVNILSNTFLKLFNSTTHLRVWSEPFNHKLTPEVRRSIFFFCVSYMLNLVAALPPQFAVSSMEDYKVKSL
ncbi:ABCA5 protein, partial [Bucco capensis]|nr:ABCA5 protein [Bucco capensis]